MLTKHEEAIECYDEALSIKSNYSKAWINKAAALNELKQFEEAVKCSDKALSIESNEIAAWSEKGAGLKGLGNFRKAIECYDEVLDMDSDDAQAWYYKGLCLDALDRYKEAIECYDEVINLDSPLKQEAKNRRQKATSHSQKAPEEAPSELKPDQIERMVYDYIVDQGGEMDIGECAEELEISKMNVRLAIEILKGKGKLEEE